MTKELTPAATDYLIELGLTVREFTAVRNIVSKIIAQKRAFDSTYIVCFSRDLSISEWDELAARFRGSLLIVSGDEVTVKQESTPASGYYYEDHTGLHFLKDYPLR